MGEGRQAGRSTDPPATWELSVGRPSERGVIQQRAHVESAALSVTVSVTNQDLLNHSKLYTGPNQSVWLGLFIVGQLQAQRVMSLGWQRSVGRVWQDTSTWERRARFVIWHHYSFPSVAPLPRGRRPTTAVWRDIQAYCVTAFTY